jgi:hypothetical protein
MTLLNQRKENVLEYHERAQKMVKEMRQMSTQKYIDVSCSLISDLLEAYDLLKESFEANANETIELRKKLSGEWERAETATRLAERLATDALTSLAGIVCTPAEGYLKAPHCLASDIGNLRKLEEAATKRAVSAENGWREAIENIKVLQ